MAEKETKSCSDCIHFDVCYKIEHFGRDLEDTSPCKQFISKDVKPVKHGHWYNRGGRFRCSVCDNKALLKDIGGTGGWSHEYEQQKSPYCPNCGAKMDGG